MNGAFNPFQIQQILERTTWTPNFQPATDRDWWESARLRANPLTIEELRRDADAALVNPPVFMPASVYLKFRENGDRREFETLIHSRGRAVTALALMECFENNGRYLTALQDYIWAICEQSTWSYPAHLADLPDVSDPYIDLSVAMTGLALSDVYLLLGDRFDPGVSRRLRHEFDVRIWSAYLAHQDFHWQGNWLERTIGNWTAVCTAGVLGSAINMNLEPKRLALIVDRGLRSLDEYLETFDPDGGSSEGPGYWDYGFGYYSIIAQLLAQRTEGMIDLFEKRQVREIAQFPLRTQLSRGAYVTFSDCSLDVEMEAGLLQMLAQRLDLPGLLELRPDYKKPRVSVRGLTWLLRDLALGVGSISNSTTSPLPDHVWFSGLNWMISRDQDSGIVLAIKGGHNQEQHNQNDVGSLIVHLNGESLITDPGRGKYTRQYFGPERYDFLVNNSRGHSTPVVNGSSQVNGREAAATVIDHSHDSEMDRLALDMTAAYPLEANLRSLVREATFDRMRHVITLKDSYEFVDERSEFESVLITFSKVSESPGEIVVQGERSAIRIRFDSELVRFSHDTVENVELDASTVDIHRLLFSPKTPSKSGSVSLTIEPRL